MTTEWGGRRFRRANRTIGWASVQRPLYSPVNGKWYVDHYAGWGRPFSTHDEALVYAWGQVRAQQNGSKPHE